MGSWAEGKKVRKTKWSKNKNCSLLNDRKNGHTNRDDFPARKEKSESTPREEGQKYGVSRDTKRERVTEPNVKFKSPH